MNREFDVALSGFRYNNQQVNLNRGTRGKTPGNGKSLIERRFWSAAVDATCGCRQVLRRVAQ
jgi:hypothetical protein